MKRKLILGNEELEFKMTNKTIFDIDEKFNNFGEVINGVMNNTNLYNNSLKVISCACITRELTIDELIEKLKPEQITKEIVSVAYGLYFDYMGIKLQTDKNKSEEDITKKKEI
ncbi:RNA polymerase subunit sigma [Eubacterium multiforme]|uniref:Phage tail assembly chaperone protein, TAC n=1 Tax=Eubacterium multiforme TaxID=83339 RepID=A0ABT9USC6_9FIRM|nr:RNA polymerase subunit sigma [Eubacterium multiforme]MDQ0149213.1 hypothetical protein [Eubacterium multiforme]